MSQQWWIFDIDGQQATQFFAIQQLPVELQPINFWYHFSSSVGIKPDTWLERPCSDDKLKA